MGMRKLPGKIDGKLITREFFPEYLGDEYQINCGHCYRWAYIAYKLYEGVELISNEGHAFPYQRGNYFDSESPRGEKSLESLSCNSANGRGEEDCFPQDANEFVDYWANHGRYGFDVDGVDKEIRNFWRRYNRKHRNRKQPS
jgi:hypothetical protein